MGGYEFDVNILEIFYHTVILCPGFCIIACEEMEGCFWASPTHWTKFIIPKSLFMHPVAIGKKNRHILCNPYLSL